MEQNQIAHLAGYFDAVGGIKIAVNKAESYRIGYELRPKLVLQRYGTDDPIIGKLIAYCELVSAKFSITETTEKHRDEISTRWTIKEPESIDRFLEPLMPYLVSKHRNARLMLEQVIPAIENGEHLNKDGFIKLMGIADQLREGEPTRSDLKYTQEFFENEWSLPEQ